MEPPPNDMEAGPDHEPEAEPHDGPGVNGNRRRRASNDLNEEEAERTKRRHRTLKVSQSSTG
jgi:hypothetical protein